MFMIIKEYYNKINNYLVAHKLKVIIICTVGFLLLTSFLSYRLYIYDEVSTYYDSGQYSEDDIDKVIEMYEDADRFYGFKDMSVYVKLFGDKIVEKYCEKEEFEKARFFAGDNRHLNKKALLSKIDTLEAENKKKKEEDYFNSLEGRTERLRKYEKRNGIGGSNDSFDVINTVFDNLFTYDNKLDECLPTWNKNSVYKNMLRQYINDVCGPGDNYYIKLGTINKSKQTINAYKYKNYLEKEYKIDVNVDDIIIYEFTYVSDKTTILFDNQINHSAWNTPLNIVLFKRSDMWFFGGIIEHSFDYSDATASNNLSNYIYPGDNSYIGLIDEEQ